MQGWWAKSRAGRAGDAEGGWGGGERKRSDMRAKAGEGAGGTCQRWTREETRGGRPVRKVGQTAPCKEIR